MAEKLKYKVAQINWQHPIWKENINKERHFMEGKVFDQPFNSTDEAKEFINSIKKTDNKENPSDYTILPIY